MRKLVRKHLLKIETYKPGMPIEEVRRKLGLKKVIKLASNENALSPPRGAVSSITRAAKSLNRYPDSNCFYLKKELARHLRLLPSNLIIGNGSDEIITFAMRTFLKKNEEIIIARPTFLVYDIVAKVENINVKHAPLRAFRYDLESMKKKVTKNTKMIFIANPDNPTGTYVTEREVDSFMSSLREDIIVFFDEAYYEFAEVLSDYPKTLKFLDKRRVIITRSFSKIYSLAGLRIGYGIAQKDMIDSMNKVREPFNVNSLAQTAAIASLKDRRFVIKTRGLVEEGKNFIYRQLNLMGIDYIPSAANFVLVRIGKTAPRIYNKLLKKGVVVRSMKSWGLNDCIRVTIGTMSENKKFIAMLKESVKKNSMSSA